MIKNIKNIVYLFAVIILFAGNSSCKDKAAVVALDNVPTTLSKNADLSIFLAAMQKVKLESFLNGPGPFTFLAPTNAAFAAVGINNVNDLNNLDSVGLTGILLYHTINARRLNIEINEGPNATITTQSTFPIFATRNTAGTFINGATVLRKDIIASNGVIHVINKVLFPGLFSVFGTLGQNNNFKLFTQLINKTAVTSPSFAANPYTCFAPNNAALIAAGLDSTAIANLTPAAILTLAPSVRFHATAGGNITSSRRYSTELYDGLYTMSFGTSKLTISNGITKIKGPGNPVAFDILAKDIHCTNGVIHEINGFLRP